jgi:hypothetical protein
MMQCQQDTPERLQEPSQVSVPPNIITTSP